MPPRVILAGFNIDRGALDEARDLLGLLASADPEAIPSELSERARRILEADNWTPETISAAYARVSRDPRSVTELRAIARRRVDKARRSNETIVFGLGHASVAEHAVFNLDILGLSRLAVETVQSQRLSSYTEKSQRYILLEEDWVLPEEIRGHPVEESFRDLVARQNRFYREAYERLLPHVRATRADLAAQGGSERVLEGLAKEDARYVLSLATTVQLGETINARNLERLISRCRAHSLQEVRELAEALMQAVGGLAPSLIKYTEPTAHQRLARAELEEAVGSLGGDAGQADELGGTPDTAGSAGPGAADASGEERRSGENGAEDPDVRLISCTPDPDGAVVAALLFAGGHGSMLRCRERAESMSPQERRRIVLAEAQHIGPHDPVAREYEHADLTFELIVSASCFAQLKRHRMATLTVQPYRAVLGVTIPPSYEAVGLVEDFRRIAGESEECARKIAETAPAAAAYALTNAHRRRVLLKLNARELVHMSRLREDEHAQWDIRRVVGSMVERARREMPLSLLLAAGKDRFAERRREIWPGE